MLSSLYENRHSVRRFKSEDVPENDLERIIMAAGTAPSGKNIQNWHFVAIKNRALIQSIGTVIRERSEAIAVGLDALDAKKANVFRKFVQGYTLFALEAPVLIVVYTTYYYPSGYHELKLINADAEVLEHLLLKRSPGMQNLGAALENFSLAAVELGYGSCWLTSANYAASEIEALLLSEIGFEKEGYFMGAMMALGVPDGVQKSPKKKSLEEIYTLIR